MIQGANELATLQYIVREYDRLKKQRKVPVKVKNASDTRSLVGFNLRSERLDRHLTVAQLAARTGVSASTIRNIENQEYNTTLEVVGKLADGLGMHPSDLLKGVN